jgi:hypothetical protein
MSKTDRFTHTVSGVAGLVDFQTVTKYGNAQYRIIVLLDNSRDCANGPLHCNSAPRCLELFEAPNSCSGLCNIRPGDDITAEYYMATRGKAKWIISKFNSKAQDARRVAYNRELQEERAFSL